MWLGGYVGTRLCGSTLIVSGLCLFNTKSLYVKCATCLMCVYANYTCIIVIVYSPVHRLYNISLDPTPSPFSSSHHVEGESLVFKVKFFKVKFFKVKFCHVTRYYKSTLSTRAILWQLVYLQSFCSHHKGGSWGVATKA